MDPQFGPEKNIFYFKIRSKSWYLMALRSYANTNVVKSEVKTPLKGLILDFFILFDPESVVKAAFRWRTVTFMSKILTLI